MRFFAVAIALLAAMPAFADEPVQVQLNMTLLSGSASILDRAEVRSLLPKEFKVAGAISSRDATKLMQIVHEKCGAKLLAEPKLVSLIGQPAMFHVGGQVPIKTGDVTEFEPVGTQVQIVPNQFPGSNRIHLECHTSIRNRTEAGGINAQKMAAEVDLGPSQSLLVVQNECPSSSDRDPVRKDTQATIIVITPQIVAIRSQPLTPAADQAKHVATMLVGEYQQACASNNAELATKLAHMAVELDPMCFNITASPVAIDPVLLEYKPMYFKPEPDFPLEKELATQQGYDRLAIRTRKCEQHPTEKEILAAVKTNARKSVSTGEVEIICEKISDRLDPPMVFPLVGQAQLRHCQWKCTVCYNDSIGFKWPLKIGMKTQRTAVVYIDKNRLECESHRN